MSHIVTLHHKELNVYLNSFDAMEDAQRMAESLAIGAGVISRDGDVWTCDNSVVVEIKPGLA